MRRPWVAVAIALILATNLVGCLGTSSDPSATEPGSDTEDSDLVERLELSACREQIGIFGMDQETVAPYMPEGFEPMPVLPPEVYQGADPSGQTATLLLVGFVCDEPSATSLFLPLIPVMPPEEHREPDVYYHAVALPCIADAGTVEVLAMWGALCEVGETTIEAQAELSTGALWDLTTEASSATVEMVGNAPASQTPAGPEWVRLFHALDGQLCAVSDSRVEVHEHWQFGSAMVTVEGQASFPVPDEPGLASLGMPGFALNVTYVPSDTPAGAAASSSPC